jgi:agmatine/peptidylarginine deiminase
MSHRVASPAARFLVYLATLATIWFTPPNRLPAADAVAGGAPTVPAEFERHDAILLSWNADDEGVEEAMTAVVAAVYRNLQVIVLTPDEEYLRGAMRCFSLAGIPQAAIRYVRADVDTIWTRDYGPASLRSADGTTVYLDADYETGTRSHDDELAGAIGPVLGMPTIQVPLTIEGGNLLSNGRGLCLATTKLRDANLARGYTEPQFRTLLRDVYGFNEIAFLEPLHGEPTGHIDMFATFAAANVVMVGEYDPEIDPVNAAVLDRNAERLSAIWTPWGRLRVVRVPMPPSTPEVWRTYTNVLYANGTLLVPSYPGVTPHLEAEALTTFQHLLPEWRIVPVDCNQLIALGGGVHCVTLNLSRIGRLPRPIDPRDLPEPGGVFPGDEAQTRRLLAARRVAQPFTGRATRSGAGAGARFVSDATYASDTADECEVCCPTGEPAPGPRSRRSTRPHRLEVDVSRTSGSFAPPFGAGGRGPTFRADPPRRPRFDPVQPYGPRGDFAEPDWHE